VPTAKKKRVPSYTHHKGSGQALVRIGGRPVYLGKYGTDESKQRYASLIAEVAATGMVRQLTTPDITIVELVDRFWSHVQKTYVKNGRPTSEPASFKTALAVLTNLYGRTAGRQFGPLALKAVRQVMIEKNWSRKHINDQVARCRLLFKWAGENELIPPMIYQGLRTVSGLREGRSDARETDPVEPVADSHIAAIKPFVSSAVWAMIQLQLLTGMRPGEACAISGSCLDTSGKVWTYAPKEHKTQHHGHKRIVYIGPKAKAIVKKWLKGDLQACLFSPADMEAERLAERHAARKTPMSCGNRPGYNKLKKPTTIPGDQYTVASYRRAISRGCDRAFPPPDGLNDEQTKQWQREHRWHPHQLRHNAATTLRKEFGLEAARVILGHQTMRMTELYAEIDEAKARAIIGKVG
jgi:integrase